MKRHKKRYFGGNMTAADWEGTELLDYKPGLCLSCDMANWYADANEVEAYHPGTMLVVEKLTALGCDSHQITFLLQYCLDQKSASCTDILLKPEFIEKVKIGVALNMDGALIVEQLSKRKKKRIKTATLPNVELNV